jgi:hypothetical protein
VEDGDSVADAEGCLVAEDFAGAGAEADGGAGDDGGLDDVLAGEIDEVEVDGVEVGEAGLLNEVDEGAVELLGAGW